MRAPGKKIGPITVKLGEVSKTFDLRFDVHAGRFHVVVDDETLYSADTKAELVKQLERVVRLDSTITWTKCIVIDYASDGPETRRYGSSSRDLDERPPGRVEQLKLAWRVVEFSNPHQRSGSEDVLVILERTPGGSITDTHRGSYNSGGRGRKRFDDPTRPKFSIEWTEERERTLIAIRDALTSVDRKLREFLGTDVEHMGAALQTGLGSVLALPPPPPLPHEESCDSLKTKCECGAEDKHGNPVMVDVDGDATDDGSGSPMAHESGCPKLARLPCDCDAGE